jgi:nicotinamidase/pyrazinamidase
MASIFSRIIAGEIPSHRVYEDDHAFAFLDINPRRPAHTLVVSKLEVGYLFDLPPEAYDGLWRAVRKVARAVRRATHTDRVIVTVIGDEVPHAHVHLIPVTDPSGFPWPPVVDMTGDELTEAARRIRDAFEPTPYDPATALVIVDVQNDFVDPGGSLSVAGAERALPFINDEIARARASGATLVYTRDWHPETTPHFQKDGGIWPVHCVGETWGAEFHPGLAVHDDAVLIEKGTGGEDGYSGFSMRRPDGSAERIPTGLEDALRSRGIGRVVIAGFATDYCVRDTGLDGATLGFEVVVLADGVRAVDLEPGDGDAALRALEAAGAEVS